MIQCREVAPKKPACSPPITPVLLLGKFLSTHLVSMRIAYPNSLTELYHSSFLCHQGSLFTLINWHDQPNCPTSWDNTRPQNNVKQLNLVVRDIT